MKKIECFRLEALGETTNSLVARFASRKEAEKASPRAGGYGPKVVPETIIIYDTAVEFEPKLNAEAAASGLAKLTPEEKAALGLK